ncbi:MAG: DUF1192 domain-containing protein [Sphingomonadaceae bacterium]
MEADDTGPRRSDDPVARLAAQDLDPLSVAELDARIARLEAEIARTRLKREKAAAFRAAADNLFGGR